MKKATAIVLALLMVLSLAACGSASSESKTLVMATSADYPPYEFIILNDKNEQQYVGIDISVSEAIAADMGKELQVVNMDFDSLMAGLQKGDADMVLAAIEITEDSTCLVAFSDQNVAHCDERSNSGNDSHDDQRPLSKGKINRISSSTGKHTC